MALTLDQIESLARALHERYLATEGRRGVQQSLPGWDGLPEGIKRQNRMQIHGIPSLLSLIDCELAERDGTPVIVHQASRKLLDAATVTNAQIERMAHAVHECWMQNTADRHHPGVMAYDDLPEQEKQKDRDVVRFILEAF